MKKWILFAFTAPYAVTVGWGFVLLACALRLAEDIRWESAGVLTAVWRPWVTSKWEYSTTLGRGIIYQPGWRQFPWVEPTTIQKHERVHIRQTEDLMLLSFLVGLVVLTLSGRWGLFLGIWWSGGVWQLPNFVTALLRGGKAYEDSEHERAAYAQTTQRVEAGKSWCDDHPI